MSATIPQMLESALALHRRGDVTGAERGYRDLLRLQPNHAGALHLLGVIHGDRGQLDDAFNLIGQALRADPDFADAHYNLGNYYARAGKFADAERHFRRAATLQPRNATAWNNLGSALIQLQRYHDASTCFDEALKIDPTLATALTNYAIACEVEGRYDDVLPAYDRVLAVDPQNVSARYYRAMTLLSRGQLVKGWAEYIWRWKRPDAVALHGRFALPYWAGEDVRGARVLVWTEQGPGDEIMISTMLPDLVASGADVTLMCSPRMAPVFARSLPEMRVVAVTDASTAAINREGFRFQASLSELGAQLRPDVAAFPADIAPLRADPARTAALRALYRADTTAPLVGISWRSRKAGLEQEKSLALAAWEPILRTPNLRFVSLQYGDDAGEIADAQRRFGVTIHADPSIDPLTDLDGFAAQVAAMDAVVSVSNTTVHFAGALGKPTFAMIPAARGRLWYWFLGRADSPWYPSLKLYRQARTGVWGPTVTAVAADLAAWTATSRASA